jgi:CheY-like chemotaxis protein
MSSVKQLLLIDDDPELRAFLQTGLELIGGYTVLCASNGDAGLEMVIDHAPDCLIVDIRMPGLDGFQLVRAVRGDRQTAHIPMIILSALAYPQSDLLGILSGADAYLTKPVEIDVLLQTIDKSFSISLQDRLNTQRLLAEQELEKEI